MSTPKQAQPSKKKMVFTIEHNGKEECLHLYQNSCFAKDHQVQLDYGNGKVETVIPSEIFTYQGTLESDPAATVTAIQTDVGVEALVRCGDGSCWKVLPPDTEFDSYTTADWEIDPSLTGIDALNEEQLRALSVLQGGGQSLVSALALPNRSTVKQAKIGFHISYNRFNRFDRDVTRTETETAKFVNDVLNRVYISDVLVEHVIGTIRIEMDPNGQFNSGPARGNNGLLSKFRNLWNGDAELRDHDLAYLNTDHSTGVAGLAFVGQVGRSARYGTGNSFGGVARHEISHIWATGHGNGCGIELNLNNGFFSLGMCTGDGARANSNESGIARNHARSRPAGVLDDIGAYTASPQEPYCPLDRATSAFGGGRITLDVQRNDFDANNDRFEIIRVISTDANQTLLATRGNETTGMTFQGGSVQISNGSGPGGRDQLLYTPPSERIIPGDIDQFVYVVRDETGQVSFGNVRVLLQEASGIKAPSSATYLADSQEQWSSQMNPNGSWSYGYFPEGSDDFELSQNNSSVDLDLVGGDGTAWVGVDSATVSQYTQQPGGETRAVRRWKSGFQGPVRIEYRITKLNVPLTEPTLTPTPGETVSITQNGSVLFSQQVLMGQSFAGSIDADLNYQDLIDLVSDSEGDRETDGAAVHLRIIPSYHAQPKDDLLFHFPLNTIPAQPTDRRQTILDVSGNNHHASFEAGDANNPIDDSAAWTNGQQGSALGFSGSGQAVVLNESGVGNGETEMTLSVWFKANQKRNNGGLLTANGAGGNGTDFFGLIFRAEADRGAGQPLEFRARNNSLIVPGNPDASAPLDRWTHAVGTWKSGEFQRVYVNGELVAEAPNPSSGTTNNITQWRIGRDRLIGNREHDGLIDDVAVYTRALTIGEIRAMHARGRSSLSFRNEDGDEIAFANNPVGTSPDAITMSAFVEADSLNDNDGIISTTNNDSNYFALLAKGGGRGLPAESRGNNQSIFGPGGSIPIDECVQITSTWRRGGAHKLYIDGRLAAEETAGNGGVNIVNFQIGADREFNNRIFDGEIGEVIVTPRELNIAQVTEITRSQLIGWDAQSGFVTSIDGIGTETSAASYRKGSTYTYLNGRGRGMRAPGDELVFANRQQSGDFAIGARVLSQVEDRGQAGLLIRGTTDQNAAAAGLFRVGDGDALFLVRSSSGATTTEVARVTGGAPLGTYFLLEKTGTEVKAFTSADGATYTEIGSTTVSLPATSRIGVAASSSSITGLNTAEFDQILLNPRSLDTDQDGLPDAWEITHFCNLTSSAGGANEDFDNDGLSDRRELALGILPNNDDSDGDGLLDGAEIDQFSSDPFNIDTDGDGLGDGEEVNTHRTSPTMTDTDGDGLADNVELSVGSSPLNRFSLPIIARPNQLRGYWPFEQPASGQPQGIAEDLAGNNDAFWNDENGSSTSGFSWTRNGIVGDAARMAASRSNDFRVRNDPLSGSSEVTLSGWILSENRPGNGNNGRQNQGVMVLRQPNNQDPWGLNLVGNRVDFRFAPEGQTTLPLIFPDDGWSHLVLTYSRNAANQAVRRGYVNGRLQTEEIKSTPSNYNTDSTRDWRFGDDTGGDFRAYIGFLDEFAMLNKALSPAEVNTLYQLNLAGSPITKLIGFPEAGQLLSSLNGNTFTLQFMTEQGASYTVIATDDLRVPYEDWTPVGTITGNGNLQSFVDSNVRANNRRFFAVRTNPVQF